jgi:phosphoribosyl 1,2-cyclic phosphate phosphodiesterase
MGLENDVEVKTRLFEIGAVDQQTVFVVNHISHNGGMNHAELCAAAGEAGFITAYDGMEIQV